ncbi:hypothetical protein SAMN02990966_01333 [Rhodospirillales bacterium URHD0017]|nr:hypothetical protein SAMN02990966_01333 [Rhodospirillales bacterium URHD0017]
MPLSWSTLPDSQLCIVSGEGTVTRADIDTYLASTLGEGAKSYAKLIDITTCTLALDADDLDMVADRLMHYGMGERPGPVAMVVDSALQLDMAVLLKQKAGDRPFRIFTSIGAARSWLKSYQESYDPQALSTGISTRSRFLRAG